MVGFVELISEIVGLRRVDFILLRAEIAHNLEKLENVSARWDLIILRK